MPTTDRFSRLTLVGTFLAFTPLVACEQGPARDITVERLPVVEPNLPGVPTLPPAPHPVTYPDGSYSVYGLRARMDSNTGQSREVTGYVVDIYEAPECPDDTPCAAPPHFFLADKAGETDRRLMLRVVGYATRHDDVAQAVALHKARRYRRPDPSTGEVPIPVELAPDLHMKLQGTFNFVSSSGFSDSGGLLDLRDYEVLGDAGAS